MTCARVFLPQEPVRRSAATGKLVRNMDLSPAEKFGELIILLPGRPFPNPDIVIPALKAGLRDFTAQDYILPVGHPLLIAWATIIATAICDGSVTMLDYDRETASYTPITANFLSGDTRWIPPMTLKLPQQSPPTQS